ncbi:cobalt-precorrin-6A reductase [Thioclava sp. GXIMD4215]|uniref:cobalt-precorrin-6A reductase n=1 Tax=Thioclava sp. GXIMD4215 TaxID=3131928 RepID=UPI003244A00C
MSRILLLGGTTEAAEMARLLAVSGQSAVYSYAGRTRAPVAQPLPLRVGGFGGIEGLRHYLRHETITHVIDATHPFAAQMSRHALHACAAESVQLCSFERLPWQAGPRDRWRSVPDMEAAAAALPATPGRIFLAIGRQNLAVFAGAPQHHYLLRLVDPPTDPLPLPDAQVVLARGPFETAQDLALMSKHCITLVVAKNAGGRGAEAKIEAARQLQIPVIMIERPTLAGRRIFHHADDVLGWLESTGAGAAGDHGVQDASG